MGCAVCKTCLTDEKRDGSECPRERKRKTGDTPVKNKKMLMNYDPENSQMYTPL